MTPLIWSKKFHDPTKKNFSIFFSSENDAKMRNFHKNMNKTVAGPTFCKSVTWGNEHNDPNNLSTPIHDLWIIEVLSPQLRSVT